MAAREKYTYFVGTKYQFEQLVKLNKILDSYIIFISDTHEIYKGVNKYGSDNFIILTEKPLNPKEETLYCINGIFMNYSKYYGWKELSKAYSLNIDSESDNTTVPTSKAVKDAIDEALSNLHISENGAISGITSTEIGTITVVKGTGSENVPIKGVLVSPEYDEETRTLTIPVMGSKNPFQISLGKDIYIESGYFNENNNTLQLTRTDGEVISIDMPRNLPSIFDIVPKDTSTISMTIEDGVISAEVRISKEEGNIIETKEDGLYVSKQKQTGELQEVTEF